MTSGNADNAAPAPRIEMFSGPGCAYCAQTRTLLEARGLDYVEYDVAEPEHLEEFGRRLPRTRALPQLFINGDHIGSFEDLQALDGSGRLAELMAN
jgi:glutaredoxin 3